MSIIKERSTVPESDKRDRVFQLEAFHSKKKNPCLRIKAYVSTKDEGLILVGNDVLVAFKGISLYKDMPLYSTNNKSNTHTVNADGDNITVKNIATEETIEFNLGKGGLWAFTMDGKRAFASTVKLGVK